MPVSAQEKKPEAGKTLIIEQKIKHDASKERFS
jgi:hypothetical protein